MPPQTYISKQDHQGEDYLFLFSFSQQTGLEDPVVDIIPGKVTVSCKLASIYTKRKTNKQKKKQPPAAAGFSLDRFNFDIVFCGYDGELTTTFVPRGS